MRRPKPRPTLLLTALLAAAAPASAQDEPMEMADAPFEIAGPTAAAPGSAGIGFVGAYERARRGRVRSTGAGETELKSGVAPQLELQIGGSGAYGALETRRRLGNAPGLEEETGATGSDERARWGGTTRIGALYQISEEGDAAPAIGALGRLRTLYGPGRTGYEAEGLLLLGKTFRGFRDLPFGAYANLGWTTRIDPQPGERTNRPLLNAALAQAVSPDTALVVAYSRSRQERDERDFSLLQAGVRHRLAGGRAVIGLAAGTGLSRDTPRFQVALALQWVLWE